MSSSNPQTTDRRELISRVMADLNTRPVLLPTLSLERHGFDLEDVFSEDNSVFALDDPDNAVVDFGWGSDPLRPARVCIWLQRVDGVWTWNERKAPVTVPPWSNEVGGTGNSDDYGDEQDRSEWYEGLADTLGARIADAIGYLSSAEGIDRHTYETVRGILQPDD